MYGLFKSLYHMHYNFPNTKIAVVVQYVGLQQQRQLKVGFVFQLQSKIQRIMLPNISAQFCELFATFLTSIFE